jgi:hypothetical protein
VSDAIAGRRVEVSDLSDGQRVEMSDGTSTRRAGVSACARRIPTWTITAACGLAYAILAPPSSDLAAASYRSYLFSHAGFTLWDNSWYGGHHLLAYSVLAPALGALLGPPLLAAISATIAAALFTLLIEGRFPMRATRVAAAWFAFGAGIELLSGRVPFEVGLALGLSALLAAQSAIGRRARWALALALALLSTLASPVAGAFLGLAALAWTLAVRPRAWPMALTICALAPIALLAGAFPEGGTQPFVASSFYPALAGSLLLAALFSTAGPRAEIEHVERLRVLRAGALLYAVALLGAFVIPTAVGGNATRLGALVAGPLAACVFIGRPPDGAGGWRLRGVGRWQPGVLVVLAMPLLCYWQVAAPLSNFASAVSDPAVHASYYAPLLGELRTLGIGYGSPPTRPARIEVVPTRNHWEARWVAPHVMLARGWERQLDTNRDALFYDEAKTPLTAARYRRWLSNEAISYVALPDAPLDYSAKGEARLLRGEDRGAGDGSGEVGSGGTGGGGGGGAGPPSYLREIWRSAHWRLFAVLNPQPLVEAPASMTALSTDSFTVSAPRTGAYVARVRFTPYWALTEGRGCVRRAPGGWTEVQAHSAGSLHVAIDFSLQRMLNHGSRCS